MQSGGTAMVFKYPLGKGTNASVQTCSVCEVTEASSSVGDKEGNVNEHEHQ